MEELSTEIFIPLKRMSMRGDSIGPPKEEKFKKSKKGKAKILLN
jgi:hypothetical protein